MTPVDPRGVDEIIAKIISREGGVADVGDGKGVTRWGQTPRWLTDFNLPIPTDATEAAENYAEWLRVTGLEALISRGVLLADVVIDWAVHSGHVTAIKALQGVLGVTADGMIGPQTLTAIGNLHDTAVRVMALRIEQQGQLISKAPAKYATYAHGWARRNADLLRGLTA